MGFMLCAITLLGAFHIWRSSKSAMLSAFSRSISSPDHSFDSAHAFTYFSSLRRGCASHHQKYSFDGLSIDWSKEKNRGGLNGGLEGVDAHEEQVHVCHRTYWIEKEL